MLWGRPRAASGNEPIRTLQNTVKPCKTQGGPCSSWFPLAPLGRQGARNIPFGPIFVCLPVWLFVCLLSVCVYDCSFVCCFFTIFRMFVCLWLLRSQLLQAKDECPLRMEWYAATRNFESDQDSINATICLERAGCD